MYLQAYRPTYIYTSTYIHTYLYPYLFTSTPLSLYSFGVGLGGMVEAIALKLGLPTPTLTKAQQEMRISKIAEHTGAAIGVSIGCIIGMCVYVGVSM